MGKVDSIFLTFCLILSSSSESLVSSFCVIIINEILIIYKYGEVCNDECLIRQKILYSNLVAVIAVDPRPELRLT